VHQAAFPIARSGRVVTLLLHISDPHFGTEQAPVLAALIALVRQQKPDVLVLSGDITQRAKPSQFAAARSFINALGVSQFLSLPGNHDISLFNLAARVLHPYANYLHDFGPDLDPCIELDDVLIVGVNTTVWNWHKDGRVSDEQIAHVAARLARSTPRQLRIVVVHQPVHVPRLAEKKNLLVGRDAAVRAWSDAGADLILGGHIHLPFVHPLAERYPGLSRQLWTAQAGTAVSNRTRADAPNSVNLIRFDAASDPLVCEVERWDCPLPRATFGLVDNHRIELDRSS
jgi:3',5'-cyclic AMP phosphodiesterase CpdA